MIDFQWLASYRFHSWEGSGHEKKKDARCQSITFHSADAAMSCATDFFVVIK